PFFTIQLISGSSGYKQPTKLGIDSGYVEIGFSITTLKEELLCGRLHLLEKISERIKEKKMYRKQRRSKKRYRPPRFNNRRRPNGWLAPSIQHKLDAHKNLIKLLEYILPITKICIEVANFDIEKIKNPSISGVEYLTGEKKGYSNIREYVLHRDDHTCQNPCCKQKNKKQILEVHHLGYWKKDRSSRPSNMITLCTRCHVPKNHQEGEFLHKWNPKLKSFKSETFMSIIRWRLVDLLKCEYTYGYLIKQNRFILNLPKTHWNDAFIIAGGNKQNRAIPILLEQIRRNNRSLQRFYDAKYIDKRNNEVVKGQMLYNGRRIRNRTLTGPNLRKFRGEKVSKGRVSIRRQRYDYQPNDLVKYQGKLHKVRGMQCYGDYIKLKGIQKSVRILDINPSRWRKGICQSV
ncbi:MAG: RNA-guided endonuclease IscB, partial [Candidatus Hodarchaeota archaeon]